MKILIVDDEREITENIAEFLQRKGYSADVAFDGKRAWDLIKTNNYDIVFLDFNMPELTGLEVIEYIKKNNIKTKTVMITAYPEMEEFFAKRLGADEYITKPYQLQTLEDIIIKYQNSDK